MSARCKVIISFTADYPGESARFVEALLATWERFPGITNQGYDFQVAETVWTPRPVPATDASPGLPGGG